MPQQEIFDKLTPLFRSIFSDPTLELNPGMTANDVENWDSLTHMLMINEVETQFGIKFKLKDLNKMKRVGDLVAMIECKLELN